MIFEDPLRRRWKRAKILFATFVTLTLVIASLVIAGLIIPPQVNDPFSRIPSTKAVMLEEFLETDVGIIYEHDPKKPIVFDRRRRPMSDTMEKNSIVAFMETEDPASVHSLERHIDKIDVVVPDWFEVGGSQCALVDRVDSGTYGLIRNHNVFLFPRLVNASEGEWNIAGIGALLRDPSRRNCLIEKITARLVEIKADGINIDFEQIDKKDAPFFFLFLKSLRESLHRNDMRLTVDLSYYDAALPLAKTYELCDYLMIMVYDQHHLGSGPGPIAARQWYEYYLNEVNDLIGMERVVVLLGNYGYDWGGGKATSISFRRAMDMAKKYNVRPVFLREASASRFRYYDTKGAKHEVYYQGALSFFNQLRYATHKGYSYFGFWRLGEEDESIWDIIKEDDINHSALEKIEPIRSIEYAGSGEILTLADHPTEGKRSLLFAPDGSIESAVYTNMPTGFLLNSRAGRPRQVLLSFDDGPGDYTEKILDVLHEFKVQAVFFILGEQAAGNPDLVIRMANEGHFIGNHTYTHPHLENLTLMESATQIGSTERLIGGLTGKYSPLFRPPYTAKVLHDSSEYSEVVRPAMLLGYMVMGANIDSQDWTAPGVPRIVQNVIDGLEKKEGRIVLMHDAGGDRKQTVAALRILIPRLRSMGYEFVGADKFLGVPRSRIEIVVPSSENIITYTSAFFFSIRQETWLILSILFFAATLLSIARIFILGALAVTGQDGPESFNVSYKPKVTVLVPAYNEENVIERTLTSLLSTRYENLEVLVINDGSTDATARVVATFAKKNKKVKIFTVPNQGKANAANFGLKKATGEIIVAIDADTLVSAHSLPLLVRHFESPEVTAVCGNVEVGNVNSTITLFQAIEYVTSQNFDRRAFSALNCISVVPGALGAWRRKSILEAGGWSHDTLTEDADLTLTILRRGGKIVYEPHAKGRTEAPESLAALLKQRFRWTFGTYQCIWKHRKALFHGSLGLFGLPNMVMFQIVFPILSPIGDAVMLLSIIKGDWQSFLSGYLAFLTMDLAGSLLAFALDRKPMKWLLMLLIQRFTYRQLMYYISLKAMIATIRGSRHGWQKLERTGSVQ